MSTKRISKKVVTAVSAEAYDESLSQYAQADAKESQIVAKMDVEITKIREKYAEDLAKLKDAKDQHFEVIQTYCTENKDTLFTKKKSVETVHGVVGFNTNPPALKTLKGFTWGSVTNMLKEFLPNYVRTKDEPKKDELLNDRENEDVSKLFEKCGVYVAQDESFYIKLKKEEVAA
jgi:phage host-nuclease inhibitor protein Gam